MPDWLQYVVPPLVVIAVMAGIIAYAFGGREKRKKTPPPAPPAAAVKPRQVPKSEKPESDEPWAERQRLLRRLRRS